MLGAFYLLQTGTSCAKGDCDTEMVQFLQEYLRINTAHPNPDYAGARALLKKQALKDGFLYQEVSLPSGLAAVIITLEGTDPSLEALAMNHHMDVVPAPNEEEWIAHPFKAEIYEGNLIARGVQDMKGVGAIHYFALKALKDSGTHPQRTIHIFAVPDEERGGFKGTKEFIESDAFRALNVGYVLDEGRASEDEYLLKVDERKPLQVRITCTGELAHGSRLMCKNAVHDLIKVLTPIVGHHEEQQKRAATKPDVPSGLKSSGLQPNGLEPGKVEPGRLLSMNITSLNAGYVAQGNASLNVVPHVAQATIDIRVPPSMTLEDAQALLGQYCAPHPNSSYRIEATVDERPENTSYETPLYKALVRAINSHGQRVEPLVSEGASDLRYYLKMGLEGIGFSPFLVKDNIHGTDEMVPVEELKKGRALVTTFLEQFCC